MSYKDFTQMSVWQKGFKAVVEIYKITKQFPSDERFGMISDMRRAANSVTHNIAEGFGRFEARDKTRFYKISRGSAYELISQILVSVKLNYVNDIASELIDNFKTIINELDALIISLEKRT